MITKEEIQKLCDLARINISTDEQDKLQKDIEGILGYIGQVKSAKCDGVKTASFENINSLRLDKVSTVQDTYTEKLINLSPKKQGRFFKTKKIL
jgi:aspartyl-tRNA(Asn)/glutamyl-tRNA(Gln) amidotransferase subunit C